jgi:OTT_1508-like deaminase
VRPPAVEPIEVLSGSRDVLNLRCRHISFGGITRIKDWKQVTDVYAKAQQGQPAIGKKKVKFTQHCEITLALDMLERTQPIWTNPKIEIGMSKACCEWCYEYLSRLDSAYPRHSILVRASNGTQPDGWLMPPNGLKPVEEQMTGIIEGKVDSVIWSIINRRRSDSNELPSFTTGADMGAGGQAMRNRNHWWAHTS